jgi:hypothetical protein
MLTSTVKGEQQAYAAIDRQIDAVSDWRKLPGGLQPQVDIYLDYETRHLDSEGSGEWISNTERYQARKFREVGDKPQMQYSGDTYRSLTDEADGEFVREEGPSFLRVGSSHPLARYHHEGAGRLPVRPIIVVTEGQRQAHFEEFVSSHAAHARASGWRVL